MRHLARSFCLFASLVSFAALVGCSGTSPTSNPQAFCQEGGTNCPSLDKLSGAVSTGQLPTAARASASAGAA